MEQITPSNAFHCATSDPTVSISQWSHDSLDGAFRRYLGQCLDLSVLEIKVTDLYLSPTPSASISSLRMYSPSPRPDNVTSVSFMKSYKFTSSRLRWKWGLDWQCIRKNDKRRLAKTQYSGTLIIESSFIEISHCLNGDLFHPKQKKAEQ